MLASHPAGDVGELTSSELELALTFFALYGGIGRDEMTILQALQEFDVALPPVSVVNRMLSLAVEGHVEGVVEQYRSLPKGKSFYRRRSTATAASSGPSESLEQALLATTRGDAPFVLLEHGSSMSTAPQVLPQFLAQEEWIGLLRVLKRSYVFVQEEHRSGLVEERDSFAAIASLTTTVKRRHHSSHHLDECHHARRDDHSSMAHQPSVGDDANRCTSSCSSSSSASSSCSSRSSGGDANGKSSIEAAKLQRLCANFGLTFDVDAFITALDENGDGSVDFKEFLALVSSSDDALEAYLPSFVACGGREVCVTADGMIKPPSASTSSDATALLLTVRDLFRSLPYLPAHLVEEVPPNKHVRRATAFRPQRATIRGETVTTQQRRLMQAFGRSAAQSSLAGGPHTTATSAMNAAPSTTAKKPPTPPFDCDPSYVTLQRYAKIMFRWGKRPRELNTYLQDRLTKSRKKAMEAAADNCGEDACTTNNKHHHQPAVQLLIKACREGIASAADDGDMPDDVGRESNHEADDVLTGVRAHQEAVHKQDAQGDPLTALRLEGSVIGARAVSMMAESVLNKHHQRVVQHHSCNAQALARFETIAPPSRFPRFSPQRDAEARVPLHAPRRMCTPPTHTHAALSPSPPTTTKGVGVSGSTAFVRSGAMGSASSPRPAQPQDQRGDWHNGSDRCNSTDGLYPAAALFREEATPMKHHGFVPACATIKTIVDLPPTTPSWWASMRAALMDRKQLAHDTRVHMAQMTQWARSSSSAGLTTTTTASATPLSMAASSCQSVALTQILSSSRMGAPLASPLESGTCAGLSRPASKRDTVSQLVSETDDAEMEASQPMAPGLVHVHVPSRPNTAGRTRVAHPASPIARRASPGPVLLARRSPPLIRTAPMDAAGSRRPRPREPLERPDRGRRDKRSKAAVAPLTRQDPQTALQAAEAAACDKKEHPPCAMPASPVWAPEGSAAVVEREVGTSRKLSIDSVREGSATFELPRYPAVPAPVQQEMRIETGDGGDPRNDRAPSEASNIFRQRACARKIQKWYRDALDAKELTLKQSAVTLLLERVGRGCLLRRRLQRHALNVRSDLLQQQQQQRELARRASLASTPLKPHSNGAIRKAAPSADDIRRAMATLQRVGRGWMCRMGHVYALKRAKERLEEETLLDCDWMLDTKPGTAHGDGVLQSGDDGSMAAALLGDLPTEILASLGFLARRTSTPSLTEVPAEVDVAAELATEEDPQRPQTPPRLSVDGPPIVEGITTSTASMVEPASPDVLVTSESTVPFLEHDSTTEFSTHHQSPVTPLAFSTAAMQPIHDSIGPAVAVEHSHAHHHLPHRRRSSVNSSWLMPRFAADSESHDDSAPLPFTVSVHDGSPGLLGFSTISTSSRRSSSHNHSDLQRNNQGLHEEALHAIPVVSNPFFQSASRGNHAGSSSAGMLSASRIGGTAASFGRSLIALLASTHSGDDGAVPPTYVGQQQPPSEASVGSTSGGGDTTCSSPMPADDDVPSLGDVDFHQVPAPVLPKEKFDGFAAPNLMYRVAKGYSTRRRLYLRLLRVRFEKPALRLQRVGRALRARRRLGDQVWALRDAKESIGHWRLRHQSAICIQCFARKCMAVQRLKMAKRKNQLRVELRVVSEVSTITV